MLPGCSYSHNEYERTANTYGRYRFAPAVDAMVEADPTFPADTTTHNLRHHYVSLLISSGTPRW